jgi:hypothetical protein
VPEARLDGPVTTPRIDTAKVSKGTGPNIGASKAPLLSPGKQTIPSALLSRTSEIVKTVADQFAETLAAAGVKWTYGIVGDSLNGLTDAIRRQGKIEWVHGRHGEVAAFCGRCRGAPDRKACDCQRSSVLAIAAQIRSAELGAA